MTQSTQRRTIQEVCVWHFHFKHLQAATRGPRFTLSFPLRVLLTFPRGARRSQNGSEQRNSGVLGWLACAVRTVLYQTQRCPHFEPTRRETVMISRPIAGSRLACTPGPHLHAGRRGRSRLGSRSRHSGGVSASQCDNSHDKVRDRPLSDGTDYGTVPMHKDTVSVLALGSVHSCIVSCTVWLGGALSFASCFETKHKHGGNRLRYKGRARHPTCATKLKGQRRSAVCYP
jgi:hypothetical protein